MIFIGDLILKPIVSKQNGPRLTDSEERATVNMQ